MPFVNPVKFVMYSYLKFEIALQNKNQRKCTDKYTGKNKAIKKLIALKNINNKQAQEILDNISNYNITPMKLK